MTRAVILASTDGSSFSQVGVVDPVTSANRTGSRAVTVPGSGAVNVVYFKMRVQRGTAAAEDGAVTTVSYQPPPPAAKSSELPSAPNLVINGSQVGQSSLLLFWGRVNDRFYRDNVNYYEVQKASNPDFTGASITNVGNTAAGMNLYENIFYTATGLADDLTWYFRVRAVNNVGTGPWSSVDSILVRIQDRPLISPAPIFPSHLATNISKTPALEVSVSDADGDAFYCGIEISESPTGPWYSKFSHGGQSSYLNITRMEASDWNSPLKPNTRYYWRAIAWEDGRDKNYYGGSWPTSPIWEFVTESTGTNLTFSAVSLIAGTVQPEGELTYQIRTQKLIPEQSSKFALRKIPRSPAASFGGVA